MTIANSNAATIGYSVSSPSGAFTAITPVKEITFGSPEFATIPTSAITDTSDQKIPGYVDSKTASFMMGHNSANKTLLSTTLPGILAYYEITLADASTFIFQGFIKSFKAKAERNSVIWWDVTIEITGTIAYA